MSVIVILILYFLVVIGVSIFAYKATTNHKDYILGGRNLGGFVTAMGVGASDMSGWLLLGLPGAAYLSGVSQIWMPIGLIIGALVNWQYVAKRLRVYTVITRDALTVPSYISNRFARYVLTIRGLSAFIVLIAFTFYCAAGFVGIAKLGSLLFEVPYTQALYIGAPIIIIYTVIGGFLAINWVDVFQGMLMLFALLLVPCVVLFQLGASNISALMAQTSASYTNFTNDIGIFAIFSLLAWGLGYFGQPHILVRFMAIKTPKEIALARNIGMSWMVLSLIGAMALGIFGYLYYTEHNLVISDPELVFIELSKILLPTWMLGIILAAILSAIMSTIAAQLMVSASALQEDFYHIFIRPKASGKELLWIGRLTVLLVAGSAILLSSNPESTVLKLVSHAWAALGATFGPVILLSLFWKRMNGLGALVGMISGMAGIIVFGFLLDENWIIDVYELLPGFICGTLGVIIGSYLSKPPNQKIIDDFNLMLKKTRESN